MYGFIMRWLGLRPPLQILDAEDGSTFARSIIATEQYHQERMTPRGKPNVVRGHGGARLPAAAFKVPEHLDHE